MKKINPLLTILAIICLTIPFMTGFPAYAASNVSNTPSAIVSEGCGGGIFDAYALTMLDSFEGAAESSWSPVSNTAVPYVSVPDFAPYSAFYGGQCLVVPTVSGDDGQTPASRNRSVSFPAGSVELLPLSGDKNGADDELQPDGTVDLSSYASLGLAILCPDSALTYTAVVNLSSPAGNRAFSAVISGGVWNALFCGLDDWNGSGAVSEITVTVRCSELDVASSYAFCIDSLALFDKSPEFLAPSMSYLTAPSNYYIGGASLDTGLGTLLLTPRAETLYIETYSLPDGLSLRYDELRLRINNSCGADYATLYYTTDADMTFSEERSYRVTVCTGEQNLYFPLDPSARQLRVSFDGADYLSPSQGQTSGDTSDARYLEITAFCGISTGASYSLAQNRLGSVDYCVWSSGSVIISGTLTQRAAELYRGYPLELFALSPADNDYAVTSGRTAASLYVKVSDTFKFKLETTDPETALTGRYLVAINYGGTRLTVGSAYVSNPDDYSGRVSFASSDSGTPKAYTIKGVVCGESSEPTGAAVETYLGGAGNVVCEIRLEKLISVAETGLSEAFGQGQGVTVWFNEDYVARLDSLLRAYSLVGTGITLRLTVSHTSSVDLNSLICHPDTVRSARYSAFNTTTQTGLNTLGAAVKFIALRYHDLGVTGFILGYAMNDSYESCNMGVKDLADFISGTTAALRLTSSVLRMYGGSCRIYVSVDNRLDSGYPSTSRDRFDTSVFLDALSARIKQCGELDYRVEFVMKADALNCGYADRTFVGVSEIERLTSYMSNPSLCLKNSSRGIMITSDGVPAETALAYSYYRLCGQSSLDSLNLPLDTLSRYEKLYRYIDTPQTLEASSAALFTLGFSGAGDGWGAVVPGFDSTKAVRRGVYEVSIVSELPPDGSDGIPGSYILDSSLFSDTSPGRFWDASVGCIELNSANTVMGRSDVTSCSLELNGGGAWGGCSWSFEYPLDLTGADVLSLELALAKLPTGVGSMNAVIVLSSADSRAIFSGTLSDGTVLREGSWNTASLDLTSLPGTLLSSVDTLTVWLTFDTSSGGINGRPALFIDTATLYSNSHDSEWLKSDFDAQKAEYLQSTKLPLPMTLLFSMGGVIAACLTLLAVRARLRIGVKSRRRDEDEWKF